MLSGADASFSVTAVGSLPLTYQWQRDGVDLVDGERLSGSRTSLLTLSDLRSVDLGNYSVVVENALGRRHSALVWVETSSIELKIQKQGTAVVLSWSPAGQGAMLETSGSLAPPDWRDVEGSESVTRVVLPLPPYASAFFRLVSVSFPAPAGMVAWWPGDRDAQDLQGANHGTLMHGVSFAPGMVGEGFWFDGMDDAGTAGLAKRLSEK